MDYLQNVEVLCHSSIRIENGGKVYYFDPFKIKEELHDADYIFITHEHYDHFSPEDINKIVKKSTIIITVPKTKNEVLKIQPDETKIIIVKPQEEYKNSNLEFITTVAYNKRKLFHQKQREWVGYIVRIGGIRYYIAGDTDNIPELAGVQCDVAFLPVGGLYTMNAKQASELALAIKPKIAVPIHYGEIVGSKEDAIKFQQLLEGKIDTRILIEK